MTAIFKHSQAEYMLAPPVFKRLWVVSGGQSGVDRAAMDFALKFRLPVRGWCPKGRIAEDGSIPAVIPVQESVDTDPALRTELNAFDSDATLILSFSEVRDGTVLTEECAKNFNKPLLWFDIGNDATEADVSKFRGWIEKNSIKVLNIAGPRESFRPGEVYLRSMRWLEKFLLIESAVGV